MIRYERSKSSIFLLEILINILLFSVLCVCSLQFFIKSYQLTDNTTTLHHAVTACNNVAAVFQSGDGTLASVEEVFSYSFTSISGEMAGDVYFKTGDELTALVKAEAEMLREAGADFIIYSLHDGYGSSSSGSISDSALSAYYDPILSEGYVDIVFEGHTHQRYALRDGDGVYHIQGGGDNKGITHAEARINFANGKNTVLTAEYIPASRYEHLEGDPIVDTLMDKYKDQVSAGSEVLGYNSAYRSGDDICQMAADLPTAAPSRSHRCFPSRSSRTDTG